MSTREIPGSGSGDTISIADLPEDLKTIRQQWMLGCVDTATALMLAHEVGRQSVIEKWSAAMDNSPAIDPARIEWLQEQIAKNEKLAKEPT